MKKSIKLIKDNKEKPSYCDHKYRAHLCAYHDLIGKRALIKDENTGNYKCELCGKTFKNSDLKNIRIK